jgi:uncharacterized protein (DUF433 family)
MLPKTLSGVIFIAVIPFRGHIQAGQGEIAMTADRPQSAIVTDQSILSGMPVVSGTRIPAETILAEIRTGKSRFDIFRSYPSLPADGIDARLSWETAGRPSCAACS